MNNENTKVPLSQQLVSALWASIPVAIFVTLLSMAGIKGALVPFICFFAAYIPIMKWREERALKQSRKETLKEVGLAFLVIIGLLFVIPMAVLFFTTDI